MNKYVIMIILSLIPGKSVFAQIDPFGPKQKSGEPQLLPNNKLGLGSNVKIDSADNLPPQIKEFALKKVVEMQTKGYMDASDEEVTSRGNYKKRLQPLPALQNRINFKLASVDMSSFSNMVLDGIMPEGPTSSGPWTSVSRIYSLPSGTIIRLFEWDYVADKGSINFQKEMLSETINGQYRAVLSVKKSAKGNSLTSLTWATEQKYFNLSISGHVKNDKRYNQFIAFANSIKN